MKKKLISMLLCVAMAVSVTACGSNNQETATSSAASSATEEAVAETDSQEPAEEEETVAGDGVALLDKEDYDIEECVQLGDYTGMELTKTVKKVTDGDVLLKIMNLTGDAGKEVTDPEATVQTGDTAVIDYEGKKDGIPFEGGTSQEPYNLVIGSGSFIPGFEDGVIGMKAGEKKDISLSFPEGYPAADLAGQEVVFTVELHSIKRLVIDDAWMKENAGSDFKNPEEYLANTREVLEQEYQLEAENQLAADAWNKAKEASTFLAYPKSIYLSAKQEMEANYKASAAEYGFDSVEAFISAAGASKEEYIKNITEYATSFVQEKVFVEAMKKAENITEDSDAYKAAVDKVLERTGAESADDLQASWGKEAFDMEIYYTAIVDRILSTAKITEA